MCWYAGVLVGVIIDMDWDFLPAAQNDHGQKAIPSCQLYAHHRSEIPYPKHSQPSEPCELSSQRRVLKSLRKEVCMDDIKIIYMTNHDRRYAAIKKACDGLQEEGKISDLCIPVFLERTSDWDRSWERKMKGASLVMIHLMKNGLKSRFWKDCRNFLDRSGIPYFVDAVDGDTAEHSGSLSDDMMKRFREYCLYGGMENFRNLWLYASSLFDSSIAEPPAPQSYTWAGIYDRDSDKGFTTDLSSFLQKFSGDEKPVIGLLFYREEWIWGGSVLPECFYR